MEKPTGNRYSGIKRDNAIIEAGFFCYACLEDKSRAEASPDSRYCWNCYEFLKAEAEMLSGGRRPAWIPKPQKAAKAGKNQYHIPQHGDGIMSTSFLLSRVDITQPPDATRTSVKRGPKHRPLPEGLIRQLADEGIGSKAIADRLRAEFGISVSYKTIQRVVSGERRQLALPIDAT